MSTEPNPEAAPEPSGWTKFIPEVGTGYSYPVLVRNKRGSKWQRYEPGSDFDEFDIEDNYFARQTGLPSPPPAMDAASEQPKLQSEEGEGWILWCREGECLHCQTEDDIRNGVFRLMFDYQKGEEVLPQHREEARKVADELIAEGVVHFEGDPALNLLSLDSVTAAQAKLASRDARIAELERERNLLKARVQELRDGFEEIRSTARHRTYPATGMEAVRIANALLNS